MSANNYFLFAEDLICFSRSPIDALLLELDDGVLGTTTFSLGKGIPDPRLVALTLETRLGAFVFVFDSPLRRASSREEDELTL